jgi:hypothetical protein
MNINTASLISELLYNAGWIDDGDELLLDHLDGLGVAETREKAVTIDAVVVEINALVSENEQIRMTQTFVETLEEIIEEQESCGTVLKN